MESQTIRINKTTEAEITKTDKGYCLYLIKQHLDGSVSYSVKTREHIDDFLSGLEEYPAALKLACEMFYQDIMHECCGYSRQTLLCLQEININHHSKIISELLKTSKEDEEKDVDDEHYDDCHDGKSGGYYPSVMERHGHVIRNGRLV